MCCGGIFIFVCVFIIDKCFYVRINFFIFLCNLTHEYPSFYVLSQIHTSHFFLGLSLYDYYCHMKPRFPILIKSRIVNSRFSSTPLSVLLFSDPKLKKKKKKSLTYFSNHSRPILHGCLKFYTVLILPNDPQIKRQIYVLSFPSYSYCGDILILSFFHTDYLLGTFQFVL